MTSAVPGDLVVFSHLRWVFVWQRPQHLISRLAKNRRTWFIEEPFGADVPEPVLRTEAHGDVCRVWLDVPGDDVHVGFDDPRAAGYGSMIAGLVGSGDNRVKWLYTPMALELARAVDACVTVYDVMDDLASFKDAPETMVLRQRQVLSDADLVFAGGRSLHQSVLKRRSEETHLFASGVEPEHYAAARRTRRGARPVAGYVGVIDERLDLDLIGDLAGRLPDWEIRMVGPVVKIDEALLPQAANITYPGPKKYDELPDVMAEFDVALMPFALNEATRSISPTKTLEYLAAGLPVVSTRVPDVVADYTDVVDLQDDGAGFADACVRVREHSPEERADKTKPILHWQHWDTIAARMDTLITEAALGATAARETA